MNWIERRPPVYCEALGFMIQVDIHWGKNPPLKMDWSLTTDLQNERSSKSIVTRGEARTNAQ
jgi:hypothetical protein